MGEESYHSTVPFIGLHGLEKSDGHRYMEHIGFRF